MGELISIIIPVFNIEGYIRKCIESIMQQSYSDIEIIIVDDGSTDKSGEICRKYADMDSRIVYLYQENQGSVGARKTGLVNAKGKYIVFADGDDYAEADYVEKLYELMIENDVDFVYSNYMVNGKEQRYVKQVQLYREQDLNMECRIDLLCNHLFEWDVEKEVIDCNLYGCIYKKSIIYDCYMELPNHQQYGEDLLCFCNLLMKCKSLMLVPIALYHYLIREKSLDHPENYMHSIANKTSLYIEVEKLLKQYNLFSTLVEKCQIFFINKILNDFRLAKSDKILTKEMYECVFTDLLMGKKIILYGAGVVGRSVYEQLTNYKSIEIIGWVDVNYRNIQSGYRQIVSPHCIKELQFDYVVVAVKTKLIADEIIEKLVQSGINRECILWQPYELIVSVELERGNRE